MEKKFTRTIEDFICENCGREVIGNGYTNHCPSCLWSKHVDVNPGDRKQSCGGLMKPMGIEMKGKRAFIIHECIRCGFKRKNEFSKKDNFETFLKISKEAAGVN